MVEGENNSLKIKYIIYTHQQLSAQRKSSPWQAVLTSS